MKGAMSNFNRERMVIVRMNVCQDELMLGRAISAEKINRHKGALGMLHGTFRKLWEVP